MLEEIRKEKDSKREREARERVRERAFELEMLKIKRGNGLRETSPPLREK